MAVRLPPSEHNYQLVHIHQSLSSSIISVNVALPIVATIAIILRITATRLRGARWRADDFVLIAALIATYTLCGELIVCAYLGMGHHLLYVLQNPETSSLTRILQMQYAIDITWNICTCLVKSSVILLLAHLFANSASRRFRIALQLVHLFLLLWTIASFFSVIFRCTPVKSYWNPKTKGSCLHTNAGRLIPAVLNLLTDVFLLGLALRGLWPPRMPMRQKLTVLGTFGVGLLCLAASVTRLHYAVVISRSDGYDPTYTKAPFFLWASVEPCLGIVCTCLPMLRPLFVTMHTKKLGSWLKKSLISRFIKEEPDTWWHPPPEEYDLEDCTTSDRPAVGKRANSDWSFLSSTEHKIKVREEVVSVAESREAGSSVVGRSRNERD